MYIFLYKYYAAVIWFYPNNIELAQEIDAHGAIKYISAMKENEEQITQDNSM